MNQAIARPRFVGSSCTSAYVPVMMEIGAAAAIPLKSRNTNNAGKEGARAHAMVKMRNMIYPMVNGHFRPYCSDIGPQINGPITYPTRNNEIGSTNCSDVVMLKSSAMKSIAPLGKEDPMVLFVTCIMPDTMTKNFLPCTTVSEAESIWAPRCSTCLPPIEWILRVIGPKGHQCLGPDSTKSIGRRVVILLMNRLVHDFCIRLIIHSQRLFRLLQRHNIVHGIARRRRD